MSKSNSNLDLSPVQEPMWTPIEEICRKGAQKMLQITIEQEVADFVEKHTTLIDADGRRMVVKNGYKPEREIITRIGPIAIKPSTIDDRRLSSDTDRPRFINEILPCYMQRFPNIDNLIPVLYLKGISTGEFPDVLKLIIGDNAAGVSSTTVARLYAAWEDEYQEWTKRV